MSRNVAASVTRRKLAMPTGLPVGLSATFSADTTKQTQWKAFLKKNLIDRGGLSDLVSRLQRRFSVTGVI